MRRDTAIATVAIAMLTSLIAGTALKLNAQEPQPVPHSSILVETPRYESVVPMGPVDGVYVKKSGDDIFSTLRFRGNVTTFKYPIGITDATVTNRGICLAGWSSPTSCTGESIEAVSGNITMCGSTSCTTRADLQAKIFASNATATAAFGTSSTGWYENTGDTSANIATRVPTAGAGALIYDDTLACWRQYANGAWVPGCLGSSTSASPVNMLGSISFDVSTLFDSNFNGYACSSTESCTLTRITFNVGTAGVGADPAHINLSCSNLAVTKTCIFDIDCDQAAGNYEATGIAWVGGASACTFANEIVRCVGTNAASDGGTACTGGNNPLIKSIRIAGTHP